MFLCTPYVVCFSGISLLIPHARIKWLFIDDTPCTARRTHYPCSAKSEVLRTLVLSQVICHPPEDLALVLVDYKGGATFAGRTKTLFMASIVSYVRPGALWPIAER